MIKNNLQSGKSRLFLMSVILLCSMFTSENTYSLPLWKRTNMVVIYHPKDHSIYFNFLFYDYKFIDIKTMGYLKHCNFDYSEDGINYTHLMSAETKEQLESDVKLITLKNKKPSETIQLLNCYMPESGTIWTDEVNDLKVLVHFSLKRLGPEDPINRKFYLKVKWSLPPTCNIVKSIRITGYWGMRGKLFVDNIREIYWLHNVKSN